MSREQITREDALMWLNGLRGRPVMVDAVADTGGYFDIVLATTGTLRHWRDTDSGPVAARLDPADRREDTVGLYTVGGVDIDISNPKLPFTFHLDRVDAAELGELVLLAMDAGKVRFRVWEVKDSESPAVEGAEAELEIVAADDIEEIA